MEGLKRGRDDAIRREVDRREAILEDGSNARAEREVVPEKWKGQDTSKKSTVQLYQCDNTLTQGHCRQLRRGTE